MTLDTSSAVASLNSLTAKFDFTFKNTPVYYPNICTIAPSKRRGEDYGFLGKTKGVREWLGDRQFNKLRAGRFHLQNKTWEDSLEIEREDIEDDVLNLYGMAFDELAVEAAKHPDELVFDSLVNGGTNLTWDGQYFYDSDHAWGDSGTQSNSLTYNATDPDAVTVTEFRAALTQAITAMLAFKNDAGKLYFRPVVTEITDLVCMVPVALLDVANQVAQAVILGNNSNVIIARPKIVCVPYLSSGRKFHLFYNGNPIKPLVFQTRRPLARQMKGMDDREFKNVKFMTDARYNVGYLAWWYAVLTEFT